MQSTPGIKTSTLSVKSTAEADLEAAIVQTVAYVDVFDYPLTPQEVHRYLAGVAAPPSKVETMLANGRLVPHQLSRCQGYFSLPGREDIVETRQKREAIAQRLWPEAIHYGRFIGSLPFVRMVAVTGSLAVNNADTNADIDYLVVTENGRLWLARAFTIMVVKLAARRGITLCPNYILSERAMVFDQQNLYTAHELAQMIPITGLAVYEQMRRMNDWTADFLPNADETPSIPHISFAAPSRLDGLRRGIETILRTPLGSFLEKWEMERKIRKFGRQSASKHAIETSFSANWCKGHFDGHGHWIMENYAERLHHLQGD